MVEDLIIGGGVYGTGVALELARKGHRVRLLERHIVASGASGGPGRRGVRANGRDVRELPLMKMAYDIWPYLNEDLSSGPFYERTGNLLLIEREQDLQSASARVQLQQQHGISSKLIGYKELREMEPQLNHKVKGAIFCENDGVSNHEAVTRAYAKKSLEEGVQINENCNVVSLDVENGRVMAVGTSNRESIPVTGTLFLLSNSNAADLLKDHFKFNLPIWNECLQVLITEPVKKFCLKRLVGHAHRTVSLKAEKGNRIMISGGWHGRWDETKSKGEILQSSVDGNLADAISLYPILENTRIEFADCNHLESMCIDNVPIIDKIPGISNVFLATGWSGHGWAIAPPIIKMLTDWVCSETKPVYLEPFGLKRFFRFES